VKVKDVLKKLVHDELQGGGTEAGGYVGDMGCMQRCEGAAALAVRTWWGGRGREGRLGRHHTAMTIKLALSPCM
jgi:hypothetical protein